VTIAGGLAEVDRGGPAFNMIPRTGGNRFSGTYFVNWAGDWSQGSNIDDRLRGLGFTDNPALVKSWDTNFALGGPFIRDRLWFYSNVRSDGIHQDGEVSYEIVWVLERGEEMSRIRAEDGVTGYVENRYLYSPVDYRMGLALVNFLKGDEAAARAALQLALEANPHFGKAVLGHIRKQVDNPLGAAPGSREEAAVYAQTYGDVWDDKAKEFLERALSEEASGGPAAAEANAGESSSEQASPSAG